jgi:cell division GTPase FtsZ
LSRRDFLASSAAAAATFTIAPRHVLGGAGQTPPSEQIRAAVIGCGGRGGRRICDMRRLVCLAVMR